MNPTPLRRRSFAIPCGVAAVLTVVLTGCGNGSAGSLGLDETDGASDACQKAARVPTGEESVVSGILYGGDKQVLQVSYSDMEYDCHVERRDGQWVVTSMSTPRPVETP